MNIPGIWNVFVDWSNTGSYVQTAFTFNNDGTFSTAGGVFTGSWSSHDGMILFEFTDGTVYGGSVVDGAMVGINLAVAVGDGGSWYATPSGAGPVAAKDHKAKRHPNGSPIK